MSAVLNSHLKRIGIKTSAQCPCGEADQTPEHYLQSCSLNQQARQQIWPTCVSLKTKLWGSAEDLFLTSKYAVLMGERILSTQNVTSNAEEEEVSGASPVPHFDAIMLPYKWAVVKPTPWTGPLNCQPIKVSARHHGHKLMLHFVFTTHALVLHLVFVGQDSRQPVSCTLISQCL